MSTPMDHIAYLSQEIGPRPAGTEEEQQAALYITERLQKDAHLSAQIEDFTCNSNALMTPIICYGVAIVAVLLGIILPIIAIPATVLALAAAGIAISEALDHPLLSQVFTKGVSQNIVAKYEPTQSSDAAGSRRRKVIVVANYDSGKVRRETAGVFVRALRPLRYGALGGMVAAAVFMLLRGVVLSEGAASLVLAVLAGVCLIPSAVLLVFALLEKFGPFTEAANDNASGVAVMLEVARRLGNGEVSADAPIATGEDVSFVSEKREPSSISDNLVQLKDSPIVADTAQQRKETMAALTGAPEGPLAEVAAKAAELNEKHAQEEAAADARAAYEERVRARHEFHSAARRVKQGARISIAAHLVRHQGLRRHGAQQPRDGFSLGAPVHHIGAFAQIKSRHTPAAGGDFATLIRYGDVQARFAHQPRRVAQQRRLAHARRRKHQHAALPTPQQRANGFRAAAHLPRHPQAQGTNVHKVFNFTFRHCVAAAHAHAAAILQRKKAFAQLVLPGV